MKNVSTRLLLVCAVIGVASALLLFPLFTVFSYPVIALVPVAYCALLGVWFFGGALTQSLTHRPGVAILTALFAGLVLAPFTPYGWSVIASTVTVGLFQELPFLVTLYRKWPAWLFYVAAAVIGAAYAYPVQRLLVPDESALIRFAVYPVTAASAVLFTWLARIVAVRLRRTGVARGLAPRRESAASDG